MRLAAVLACLTVAAIHPALAVDPPGASATPARDVPSAEQTPAATTDSSATTETATPSAASAPAESKAADDPSDEVRLEKRLHARGYTTRMRNGEKVFCRHEEVLGTRLGGALHCMTADEARANEKREQQDIELLRQRVMGSCLMNGNGRSANCGG